MPNKHRTVQCLYCDRSMRADNLPKHVTRIHATESQPSSHCDRLRDQPHQHIQKYSDGLTGECQSLDDQSDAVLDGETTNITDYIWHTEDVRVLKNHSNLLPRDIRAIIVGKSGCGKTILLTYLLLQPNMLDYNNLIVCGNSLYQPEYRILKEGFSRNWSKKQVQTVFKNQKLLKEEYDTPADLFDLYNGRCNGGVDATFLDSITEIPDPSEMDMRKKNVLVLDDIMLGPQNKAEAYYTRGRHNNVDVFYIAQSYFQLPRQTVRENANLFILFKQDMKNLVHIYNDHCAGDGISYKTFSDFCNSVWHDNKHNYITIDLTRAVGDGKYRKNLTHFWTPSIDRCTTYAVG